MQLYMLMNSFFATVSDVMPMHSSGSCVDHISLIDELPLTVRQAFILNKMSNMVGLDYFLLSKIIVFWFTKFMSHGV